MQTNERCLLCDKPLFNKGNLYEIVFMEDLICFGCRNKWLKNKKKYSINDQKVYSSYIYDDSFSSALIQYKECLDEVLKDIFLYKNLNWFKLKFYNYSIVLAPSSDKKIKERGFNHLKKMFEQTNMEIIDCLYKTKDISQKTLDKSSRDKIDEVIQIKDVAIYKNIVLVDDVCTTGSTLKTCIKLLKPKVKSLMVYTVSTNYKNVNK